MESKIYVKLIEGVEVKVPVKAVQLEDSTYKIIEIEEYDEKDWTAVWEFLPGDIVKCSSESYGILARSLVDSNHPNRKLYQLMFVILESGGEIKLDELGELRKEVDELCVTTKILQKKHPGVARWLLKNYKKTNE